MGLREGQGVGEVESRWVEGRTMADRASMSAKRETRGRRRSGFGWVFGRDLFTSMFFQLRFEIKNRKEISFIQ